ncbi:MAG: hypothetical protein Q4B57_10450 [Eubacteriales bacterium]|nr:hypothetical protein [Eubacteriales bacterium]
MELASAENDSNIPIRQIGETFEISAFGENGEGEVIWDKPISVRVDSVQVADDLQLIDQGDLPEEWKNAVGTDGKLVDNKISYIKSGNGTNSLDEVIKTEDTKQKLVYVTATYTNNTDEEIDHLQYLGSLVLMEQENGEYHAYDPQLQSEEQYDRMIWDGVARMAEMTYHSVSDDENGKNYIPSLKSGESIQVHMAWIVNENDLKNMYLNLSGDGASVEISADMRKVGVVDIRQ